MTVTLAPVSGKKPISPMSTGPGLRSPKLSLLGGSPSSFHSRGVKKSTSAPPIRASLDCQRSFYPELFSALPILQNGCQDGCGLDSPVKHPQYDQGIDPAIWAHPRINGDGRERADEHSIDGGVCHTGHGLLHGAQLVVAEVEPPGPGAAMRSTTSSLLGIDCCRKARAF